VALRSLLFFYSLYFSHSNFTLGYILQALRNQFEAMPRYWTMNNPRYEVDFLIQRENEIFPVEVKSESSLESKSLKKYKEKYGDKVKLRLRFSLNNLRLDDDMLNIPIFMADHTDRIIGIALEQIKDY
jgi:predicted AAA+ superfamily ATPase